MAISKSEFLLRATAGIMTMNSLAASYGYISDDSIDVRSVVTDNSLVTVNGLTEEEAYSQSVKKLRSKTLDFILMKHFENGEYTMRCSVRLDTNGSTLSKYYVSTMNIEQAKSTWASVFSKFGNMYIVDIGKVSDTKSFNLSFASSIKEDLLPIAFTVNNIEYDLLKIEIDGTSNQPIAYIYAPFDSFLLQEDMKAKQRLLIKNDKLREKSIELLKIDIRTKLLSQVSIYDCTHAYEDDKGIYSAEHIYNPNNLEKEASISLTYSIYNFIEHYCKS